MQKQVCALKYPGKKHHKEQQEEETEDKEIFYGS